MRRLDTSVRFPTRLFKLNELINWMLVCALIVASRSCLRVARSACVASNIQHKYLRQQIIAITIVDMTEWAS